MTRTIYFHISGYEVVCTEQSIELRVGSEAVMWMTFFDNDVYTVREPGRGHAGRFPASFSRDVKARVAYALDSFVERRAA